jgi:hypothetical protein
LHEIDAAGLKFRLDHELVDQVEENSLLLSTLYVMKSIVMQQHSALWKSNLFVGMFGSVSRAFHQG